MNRISVGAAINSPPNSDSIAIANAADRYLIFVSVDNFFCRCCVRRVVSISSNVIVIVSAINIRLICSANSSIAADAYFIIAGSYVCS